MHVENIDFIRKFPFEASSSILKWAMRQYSNKFVSACVSLFISVLWVEQGQGRKHILRLGLVCCD